MPRPNPQQDEKYAHAIRTRLTADFHNKIGAKRHSANALSGNDNFLQATTDMGNMPNCK